MERERALCASVSTRHTPCVWPDAPWVEWGWEREAPTCWARGPGPLRAARRAWPSAAAPSHAAAAAPLPPAAPPKVDEAASTKPLTEDDLTAYLASGCKPREAWRFGTEHEKLGYYLDTKKRLSFDTIATIITRLCAQYGWEPVLEGGAPIGATRAGASLSIEPGGQFELSGAPLACLHDTDAETRGHLAELRAVTSDLGVAFLALGFDPAWPNAAVPAMPKARYRIMAAYMPAVGGLGRDMMFRSATIQVNLDFGSEGDMVSKFRAGLGLQPIATALFANSPFRERAPCGYKSWRSHVWEDTDADRTGILPWAWEPGFGFRAYADYALDVPMYFVYGKDAATGAGRYVDATGGRYTFRQFMAGEAGPPGNAAAALGRPATLADWETHLTTIFPEVRLKRYLEMRGADGGPADAIAALPSLWVGLMYDDAALAGALDLVSGWSLGDHERLRRDVPRLGLAAPAPPSFGPNKTVADVAKVVVDLSAAGLAARGKGEERFLAPLAAAAASGQSGADRLLALYGGEWGGSIDPVYSPAFSY